MSLGEPLAIDGPVSSRLAEGARRAKAIYRGWWPGLADVAIEVDEQPLEPAAGVAACFFTRGVDSVATARRLASQAHGRPDLEGKGSRGRQVTDAVQPHRRGAMTRPASGRAGR